MCANRFARMSEGPQVAHVASSRKRLRGVRISNEHTEIAKGSRGNLSHPMRLLQRHLQTETM
jgi:hypothetical protein